MQGDMCYSRLHKASKTYNQVFRFQVNRQMEKTEEDKLTVINVESLRLLLNSLIHYKPLWI